MKALTDRFGRTATDLRISVTDRCNFRCRYCMPPEGLPWLPKDELLTFEEIERVARVLGGYGIRSIKLTGGEPLVRRDLSKLVSRLRHVLPDADISLTTNGFMLGNAAEELKDAGLDRVTVSCDSLLKHRFSEITLRDALDEVMAGLDAAATAGLTPVKINTVVMRGVNEDEVVAFAELARRTGYEVRFIEYMPLDAQDEWSADRVVPGAEILETIASRFPLKQVEQASSPSANYGWADDAPGGIGVISSVTAPFCASCDRLRLTSDGHLRACLFSLEEVDLRGPLRSGASDVEIGEIASRCVGAKWEGHHIGRDDFVKPSRSMSMIGG